MQEQCSSLYMQIMMLSVAARDYKISYFYYPDNFIADFIVFHLFFCAFLFVHIITEQAPFEIQ